MTSMLKIMEKIPAALAIALLGAAMPFAFCDDEAVPIFASWQEITIPVGNEHDGFNDTIAARQLFSNLEFRDGCVVTPFMSKAPDEARILLAAGSGADFGQPLLLESTDEAESWHLMPNAEQTSGYGLSCIGNNVILLSDATKRSADGGKTWQFFDRPTDPRFGLPVYGWDPVLVEPNSNGKHLYHTGHVCRDFNCMEERIIPLIRESFDAGLTWTEWRGIPEFMSCNEVALCYNARGEIVAGIRASTMMSPANDQSDRLETSYSTDGGKTWSATTVVAGNGRHHPCMALLPDGRMVMTYVVRKGYPVVGGMYSYGIEAVVSYDDGHTWDTDHRYILARWSHDCVFTTPWGGKVKLEHYYGSPQCTTTLYLPQSDCLVTAFGTLQNGSQRLASGVVKPFQTSIIKWKPLPREQYSAVKSPTPAPIPAEEAYSQLQRQKYWPVNYMAITGLPDCGWKDTYPEGQNAILDGGWLRLDHRALRNGCYSLRGIDALEQINAPFGLRMRLNVPSFQENNTANRLLLYGILGTGTDKFAFSLTFNRNADVGAGSFGAIFLPTTCDVPFTLEAWIDPLSKTARLWVDGTLVCEKRFEPQHVNPKTAAVLYFGAAYSDIGDFIDLGELKLGVLK